MPGGIFYRIMACKHIKVYILFACFIDFKKAFDKVVRPALLSKIINIGINGQFYRLIKSMYTNNYVSIKLGNVNKQSETFNTNVGVRQGDCLSPTLFNIFINDVVDEISSKECMPASVNDIQLPCLLYADNLVIFSETATGLQNALSNLEAYCNKWSLDVNVSKTKILIFNKKKTKEKFWFNDSLIDVVREYRYLGLKISYNGSFKSASLDLCSRALKAILRVMSPHRYT